MEDNPLSLNLQTNSDRNQTDSAVHEPLRKPPQRASVTKSLLTAEDVARRLNVSTDWVWDYSSRKRPLLPVIRTGDGTLRYRASGVEMFIDEHERLSQLDGASASATGKWGGPLSPRRS